MQVTGKEAFRCCCLSLALALLALRASAESAPDQWSRSDCSNGPGGQTPEAEVHIFQENLLRGVPKARAFGRDEQGAEKRIVLVFSTLTPVARARLAEGLQIARARSDAVLYVVWTRPDDGQLILWRALHEAERKNEPELVYEILDFLARNSDMAWLSGELSQTKFKADGPLPQYEQLLASLHLSPQVTEPVFFVDGTQLRSDDALADELERAHFGWNFPESRVVARKVISMDPSSHRSSPSTSELPQVELWGDLSEESALREAVERLISESRVQSTWRFAPNSSGVVQDLDLMAAEIGRIRGGEILWQFIVEASTIQGPDRVHQREELAKKFGARLPKKMSARWRDELRSLVEADFDRAVRQGLCGPFEYVVGEHHVTGLTTAAQFGDLVTKLGRRIPPRGLSRSTLTPEQRRRLSEPRRREAGLGGIAGNILSHVDTVSNQDNVTSTFGRLAAQVDGIGMKSARLISAGWAVGGGNGLDLHVHALADFGLAYPQQRPARIFARVGAGVRAETNGLLAERAEFTHLHLALPRGSVGFQYWGDDWALDIAPSISGLLAHTHWNDVTNDELGYAYGGRTALYMQDFQFLASAFRARDFLRSEAQACTQLFGKDLGVCVQGGHILGTDGFSDRARYSLGGCIGLLKFMD